MSRFTMGELVACGIIALLCVAWFVGITWGIPGVIDGR